MAKILIIDDEPDMIWAISNVLLTCNHSVISVNSGEDALRKVQEAPVDLALLDFRLPGMDGIQILEKLKQLKPELPVIMVTGYGGVEEAVQAMKMGAAHYISKPFDNDHLIEVVEKALQLTSLQKEGVFGKRIADKIAPKPAAAKPEMPAVQTAAAPSSSRSSGWKKTLLAAFAIAALGIGGWAGLRYFSSASARSYNIPHSRVSGLSWSGDSLWACDWFTQSVYQYRLKGRSLTLARTYMLPGYHLTGIAWGGEVLFTCDSWKKQIFKHTLNDSLTVVQSYPSPGTNPSGLFYDGKYLWSCDGDTKRIYQHAMDDQLTVLNSFESQSRFPVGMYKDGNSLWYSGVKGVAYRHALVEQFPLEKSYQIPNDFSEQVQSSAFTIRDGHAWVSYEGVSKLFRRPLDQLKEVQP